MSKFFHFRERDIFNNPGIMPMNEDLWFREHQSLLLTIANHPDGRDLLCIDRSLPPIIEIAKNHVTCFLDINKGHLVKLSDYRIGAKWANVIRFHWSEFSKMAKEFYSHSEFGLHRHDISGLLAATTSTFFPDPNPETTSVDGLCEDSGVNRTWADIISQTGISSADSGSGLVVRWRTGGTTDAWNLNGRSFVLYDTSSLPDTDSIDSAILSLYSNADKVDPEGDSPDTNIYSSNPVSNTALVPGDYASVGSTAFATAISYASWTNGAYNNYTFNAPGLAAIDPTGVSKFAALNGNYDVAAVKPNWTGGSKLMQYSMKTAENTGTTSDPKLVITHTAISLASFRRRIDGY